MLRVVKLVLLIGAIVLGILALLGVGVGELTPLKEVALAAVATATAVLL